MLCEVQIFRNVVIIMIGKCDGMPCHIPEEQSLQLHLHEILRTFVQVPV